MHRKVGRHAWELAHKGMHYGLTVYGDAVHEEGARRADSECCMAKQRRKFEVIALKEKVSTCEAGVFEKSKKIYEINHGFTPQKFKNARLVGQNFRTTSD